MRQNGNMHHPYSLINSNYENNIGKQKASRGAWKRREQHRKEGKENSLAYPKLQASIVDFSSRVQNTTP